MGSRSVLPSPAASPLRRRLDRTVPTGQVAKETPLPAGSQKVLGSINQFTDRDPRVPTFSNFNRNTCPCTSLAFVSHFLNHGNEGLDPEKVDQLIRIGQDRFLERIAVRRKELKEVEIPPSTKKLIEDSVKDMPEELTSQFTEATTMFEAIPSEKYPKGTKGRTGVFEVLEMSRNLEEIILKDPSSLAIYDEARKNGMITIKEDAMLKAFSGKIPFEEVMKL